MLFEPLQTMQALSDDAILNIIQGMELTGAIGRLGSRPGESKTTTLATLTAVAKIILAFGSIRRTIFPTPAIIDIDWKVSELSHQEFKSHLSSILEGVRGPGFTIIHQCTTVDAKTTSIPVPDG
jgi:hypothetical protein